MRPAAVALCALRERALAVPQRAFQVSGCSAQELSALAAQLHTLRQRLVAATPAPPVSSTPA